LELKNLFKYLVTAVVLTVLVALCIAPLACAPSAPKSTDIKSTPSTTATPPAQVYTGRLSYHWFPEHQAAKIAEKFAAYCKEMTNGRLVITTFPSGALYGINDAIGAISQGSVDMAGIVDVTMVAINKSFQLSSMGYLFSSFDQLYKIYDETDAGKAFIKSLQDKLGVTLICHDPVGPSYTFTANKPLKTVDDYKGQKARFASVAEKPALDALGTSSVSVATAEVYTALQQGMINQVNTPSSAL
jgi:TRAP-type C4-dicarboxylate transport system substrate-binding protein